jgi:predicted MFS family arabinose efflux permease
MAGTGIGAFLLPPIVEYLITNYGWRTAYRGIGLGALAISLPIVWTLFKENEANKATGAAAKRIWGYTRAEAMKMPKFWILGTVLGLTVLVMAGLLSNFKQLYTSLGMDGGNIAKLAALMGITIIFGRLLVGYLMDRFWAPAVAVGFYTMPIIGMIILLNTPLTMGTGAMVAICIGLAAGAVLDLLAYLTSKYFGPDYYAKIFGATFTFFTVGAGFAPPLFGKLAQNNGGDYAVALKFGIGVLLISCILFLLLGKYPQEAISEQGH